MVIGYKGDVLRDFIKEKFNNINIKSTKSQTQDIKDFKNEILFEEPQQFDVLLKNDKIQENQNEDISNLNINNGKNQIGYEPLENYSYIIKKLNSQRDGSSFGLNVETSQSTNERTEENQSNQNINQNIINKEEITDP